MMAMLVMVVVMVMEVGNSLFVGLRTVISSFLVGLRTILYLFYFVFRYRILFRMIPTYVELFQHRIIFL